MKQIKILLLIVATVLLFNCCEKEYGVKYYKHITGKGCAFYKYLDGTIAPFDNQEIGVEAVHEFAGMGGPTIGNDQSVKTDANGNYTSCIVKSVKGWDMKSWHFWANVINDPQSGHWFIMRNLVPTIDIEEVQYVAKKANNKNPQIISIDTVWIDQMY
jgi:hypothetical protein